MGAEQRFTEDEGNAILSRAVDLERTGASSPGVVGSLSLAEIKEVAGEAGIAPSLVETAAAEFMIAAPPGPATWLGSSERSRATRLVDTTLAVEDVGLLLRLVEDRLSQHGMVSDALGRVTWVSLADEIASAAVDLGDPGPGQPIEPGR